jgi:hypothetical protein
VRVGRGCGDDVPHLLDAVADGGDEDFQCEGVGEGSAEFGVAPVGAKAFVVVLRGRDGVERLAARMAVPVVRLMGRWCLGWFQEFARQGEGAWWVGVPVPGRAGPELGVVGSAGA